MYRTPPCSLASALPVADRATERKKHTSRISLEDHSMKTHMLRCAWLLAVAVLMSGSLTGCDSSSPDDDLDLDNCSVAYNSPDNSFARIVNRLDKHIDVAYDSLPLAGTVNKRSCDLFGLSANRTETFRIQECASGDFDEDGFPAECGRDGPTRSVQVTVAQGEIETITVDQGFFR